MSKVQKPTHPKIAEVQPHEASPSAAQSAQHKQPITDAMTKAQEPPADAQLRLHLPIPPNLRPIRSHSSEIHGQPTPLSTSDGKQAASGGQAEAVAQGMQGLAEPHKAHPTPDAHIWSLPHVADADAPSWV